MSEEEHEVSSSSPNPNMDPDYTESDDSTSEGDSDSTWIPPKKKTKAKKKAAAEQDNTMSEYERIRARNIAFLEANFGAKFKAEASTLKKEIIGAKRKEPKANQADSGLGSSAGKNWALFYNLLSVNNFHFFLLRLGTQIWKTNCFAP